MSLLEELKSLGVNVDEGLDRVMGDHALYEKIMGMYVDLVNKNLIYMEDFSGMDLGTLTQRAHVLKDISSNLAITPLFQGYTKVLDLLRADQAAKAREELEQLLPVQAEILDCIKRYRGG